MLLFPWHWDLLHVTKFGCRDSTGCFFLWRCCHGVDLLGVIRWFNWCLEKGGLNAPGNFSYLGPHLAYSVGPCSDSWGKLFRCRRQGFDHTVRVIACVKHLAHGHDRVHRGAFSYLGCISSVACLTWFLRGLLNFFLYCFFPVVLTLTS